MVDGGKGQLGMAVRILDELGLSELDVVGIAKSRLQVDQAQRQSLAQRRKAVPSGTQERGDVSEPRAGPVSVAAGARRGAPVRRYLPQEAAQQAAPAVEPRRHHRGGGEKRKVQLLRHFGSLKQVREASLDELEAVPGVPQRVAAAVYESLREGGR